MKRQWHIRQYSQAQNSLRDFQSPDGEPAAWAPGQPFHRGQELDKIILGGVGSSLSLSPDDQFLAVGVGKNIHVYSTFTREYVETLTGHLDEVSRVFFAPRMIGCGLYTLVSSAEGSIVVWELDMDGKNVSAEENKKQITFDGKFASYGAPFSPDGQKMIYLTQNSTTQNVMRDAETLPCINIWDVEAKVIRHRLLGHTDTIMWVATSPDSTLVASISWDGTAHIWDAMTAPACRSWVHLEDRCGLVAFSPDSKYIAISQGSPKTVVYVYDIEKAEEISHFEGCEHWARSLDWSPDGKLLAVGASDSSKLGWRLKFDNRLLRIFAEIHEVKGFTEVYDFTTNTKQQFARGPGCQLERGSTSKPICTANSSLLVVSDADGAVRFWRFCE
ncbi:WD40-repeat-containing domain protein [Aspergillus novoparasiticus]|uniref:WD40-repeat-containing domain protein n=1 Tax=Aspergillus novoparasiticus TaxID=986946 RepID=A0A5N6EXK4_9EURO|nr:WD40-repeat-containing domain protein [Aspergillus novoparasiticus]